MDNVVAIKGNVLVINAVIRFIESHVRDGIDYAELEKSIGLSYHHLRAIFKQEAQVSLGQYINSRKVAYAALDIESSNRTLLEISGDYNFEAYDTFTRLFKREAGVTPSEYKKKGLRQVEIKVIAMGAYAPVLSGKNTTQKVIAGAKSSSVVLYGVPCVAYATGKHNPVPACVESMLHYIGQRENCSYAWLMGASGVAFRFCWNAGKWDISNPHLMNMNPRNPWDMYARVFHVAGRKCDVLSRESTSKKDYFATIAKSIERGNPAMAIGIVGPPEACLITGCDFDTGGLYGWSGFQATPEFNANTKTDESGYFYSTAWWENPYTATLFTVGKKMPIPPLNEILRYIYTVLTTQSAGVYRTGQAAYASWANDMANDADFSEKIHLPVRLYRLFCQLDAEAMTGEGRYRGAEFFSQIAKTEHAISDLCLEAAQHLYSMSDNAERMFVLRKGDRPTEEAMQTLSQKEIRKEICELILKSQESEYKATQVIEKMCRQLR